MIKIEEFLQGPLVGIPGIYAVFLEGATRGEIYAWIPNRPNPLNPNRGYWAQPLHPSVNKQCERMAFIAGEDNHAKGYPITSIVPIIEYLMDPKVGQWSSTTNHTRNYHLTGFNHI